MVRNIITFNEVLLCEQKLLQIISLMWNRNDIFQITVICELETMSSKYAT